MAAIDDEEYAEKFRQVMRLQERFDKDPSIENYVALRRSSWGWDAEVHRFAGVDPFQALGPELERAGLDRGVVCGALGGDHHDIDELCLQLMERLIDRKHLEAKGETHLQGRSKAISDAVVGHLVVSMLEVLQQDSLEPRPSLVLLVREQLGGGKTEIYRSHTMWVARNRAVFLGMQMRRRGVQPTIRKIAEIMGVQPSTVSRWFPNGDYSEQVAHFEKSFVKL